MAFIGDNAVAATSAVAADRVLVVRAADGKLVKVLASDLANSLGAIPTGPYVLDGLAAAPTAPPEGDVSIYSRVRAGRPMVDVMSGSGRDYPLQPFLGLNRVSMWLPNTTTTITIWGMPITSVGVVSTPTLAATNLLASASRWRQTSAATANAAAENRCAQTVVWRGNAAGLGGFQFVARVAIPLSSTNGRGFFGLTSSTGAIATTQVPSALTNCAGFAWNATETTLRWQVNDASGVATRTDLGANFPSVSTAALYSMFIFCRANDDRIRYRIVREDTGDILDGESTTDIPTNTTFMTPHLYMNNGGDAAAVAYESTGVYIEKDT